MPPRSKPLPPGKPLAAGSIRRRAAIVRSAFVARSVRPSPRKAKTRVGEFSPKTRRLLLERFGRRCAWCGDPLPPKWWTGQHRRARQQGGSSDPLTASPANGVAMHQLPCHDYVEAHPGEARTRGFRVPQGTDPRTVPLTTWTGERVLLTEDGGWEPVAAHDLPTTKDRL